MAGGDPRLNFHKILPSLIERMTLLQKEWLQKIEGQEHILQPKHQPEQNGQPEHSSSGEAESSSSS